MDSVIQIVLLTSVVSLSAIFVTIGVWVILILRDVKSVIEKFNRVGDDIRSTSRFVKKKVKKSFDVVNVISRLGTMLANKGYLPEKAKRNKTSAKKIKKPKNPQKSTLPRFFKKSKSLIQQSPH